MIDFRGEVLCSNDILIPIRLILSIDAFSLAHQGFATENKILLGGGKKMCFIAWSPDGCPDASLDGHSTVWHIKLLLYCYSLKIF